MTIDTGYPAGQPENQVRLGIRQDLQVDHDVHVQSACVRWHYRRPCGNKITRCESPDQVNRLFPRPESAQQWPK